MKKISRWMPDKPGTELSKFEGWVLIFFLSPIILVMLPFALVLEILYGREYRMKMRGIVSERSEESICTFVRQFDVRNTDTWILRAVYEEFSEELRIDGKPFPVHADDLWLDDLLIDPEEMDDFHLKNIAYRSRRSLSESENNPLYGKVNTIRDIVHFLEFQPQLNELV